MSIINLAFPSDLNKPIFSQMDFLTLGQASLVSKNWRAKCLEIIKKKVDAIAFGPNEWKTYLAKPGKVVNLPDAQYFKLMAPNPFNPSNAIMDDFLLFFLPELVDLETDMAWNELHAARTGVVASAGAGYSRGIRKGKNALDESLLKGLVATTSRHYQATCLTGGVSKQNFSLMPQWVLLSQEMISGSVGKSKAEMEGSLKQYGFQLPNRHYAIAGILTHYVATGIRLYTSEEGYIRCLDTPSASLYPEEYIAVGNFEKKEGSLAQLRIKICSFDTEAGAAACCVLWPQKKRKNPPVKAGGLTISSNPSKIQKLTE